MKLPGSTVGAIAALFIFQNAACRQSPSPWSADARTNNRPVYFGEQDSSGDAVRQAARKSEGAKSGSVVADQVDEYVNAFPQPAKPVGTQEAPRGSVVGTAARPPSPKLDEQVGSMRSVSLADLGEPRSEPTAQKQPALPVLEGITVRAAKEEAAAPASPVATANSAMNAAHISPKIGTSVEIEKLEQQVLKDPNDVQAQLRLRYLYLAEGLADKAATPPKEMEPQRAELLNKLIRATVAAEKALRDPQVNTEEAAQAVAELHEWVQGRADLTVPRAALCTSIHSFGRFEAVPDDYFAAGRSDRAFLYCEVRNFAAEKTAEGQFRTRIAHRLELLTPQGHSVWKDAQDMEVVDVCAGRRTDFFFNRLLQLPGGINPGEYVLKVTVEDKIKAQVDETSLRLTIKPAGYAHK